ncbi:MAG TPA: hypothetical protein VHC18_03605 [Amycolatopsis sp.]|nr:hypothetical protein [Amycolatopsis sp.]
MTSEDDLDRELRRLFSDERLDVLPRAGVETEILAGARRVRRRRTTLAVTGGALTVALLLGAGVIVTDLRSGHEQAAAPPAQPELSLSSTTSTQLPQSPVPSSSGVSPDGSAPPGGAPQTAPSSTPERSSRTSTAPSTSAARSDNTPLATGPVLGPNGYNKLQLGMSFDAAKATGLLAGTDAAPDNCGDYQLTEGASAVGDVEISATYGIVSFQATGARTPEKVKIGSTKDQLEAAYPSLSGSGNAYSASSGTGGTYVFSVDSGKIVGLKLVGSGTC